MKQLIGIFCISALCALVLTGCFGSSPVVRYYALDTKDVQPNDKDISLGVGPFELPDYLNRSQIIVRGSNNQLIVNEYDRWAENLEVGISRRIVGEVSDLNPDIFAYEFIRTTSFPGDYRVFGQVTKFEANQNNTVSLEVAWVVSHTSTGAISKQPNTGRRTAYRTEITSADDIQAVTAAMNELLDQFSADIATEMGATLNAVAEAEAAPAN